MNGERLYYLPQVVLVDISCGSACIAQVSGPMWAVAPSTEHKNTKDHPKWPTGAQMAAENVKILPRAHASPTQASKGG